VVKRVHVVWSMRQCSIPAGFVARVEPPVVEMRSPNVTGDLLPPLSSLPTAKTFPRVLMDLLKSAFKSLAFHLLARIVFHPLARFGEDDIE